MTVTGPKNITTQVGANVFMECSVMGVETQPLLRWRLSGIEYTPSTLPDRFFSNATGLLIYSVSPGDNGLTVQCYIVTVDPTVGITTFNSPIGVVHVITGSDNLEVEITGRQAQK